MDARSAELLEFPLIRTRLSGYAAFEPSRRLALVWRRGWPRSQGWKCPSTSSAIGERGISTRSSTSKGRPANQASPVR